MALIHYWPLDEESGTTAVDQIAGWESPIINDSAGDSAGAVGKFDACRYFGAASGGSSHLRFWAGAEDLEYEFPQWSFCCRFRRDDTASASFLNDLLVTGAWNAGYETVWAALEKAGDGMRIEVAGSDAASMSVTTDQLFGTGWHLATIACDGVSTRLMLDGAVIVELAAAVKLQPKGQYSVVGGENGSSYNDMRVDEVALFDHDIGLTGHQALWANGDGWKAPVAVDGVAPSDSTPASAPEMVTLVGAGSPLLYPTTTIFVDWASTLDPLRTQTYFACDIEGGGLDPVRVPITSWQATLQIDRKSYVQAVVPAGAQYIDTIDARTSPEFVIRRGARFEDGTTQETEIARAPIQTPRLDEGPTRAPLTLTGYSTMSTSPSQVRDLKGIRSFSSSPARRVRCEIDWFIRPGHTATARGQSFPVDYLNYYANAQDQYMDVGERGD